MRKIRIDLVSIRIEYSIESISSSDLRVLIARNYQVPIRDMYVCVVTQSALGTKSRIAVDWLHVIKLFFIVASCCHSMKKYFLFWQLSYLLSTTLHSFEPFFYRTYRSSNKNILVASNAYRYIIAKIFSSDTKDTRTATFRWPFNEMSTYNFVPLF